MCIFLWFATGAVYLLFLNVSAVFAVGLFVIFFILGPLIPFNILEVVPKEMKVYSGGSVG
jgi:hypothetical protein